MEKRVILASKSPRRKELLATIFENFECIASDKDEDMSIKTDIKNLAKCLSGQKAEDVFERTFGDRVVLGSDTMVVLGKQIFGKPKDENHAFLMLKSLSGKTHRVVTGIYVIKFEDGTKTIVSDEVVSRVKFSKMTDEEIWGYIKTGEPMDKAGAYGCQGAARKFIEKIDGDFFAVMGLPVQKTYELCKKLGVTDWGKENS